MASIYGALMNKFGLPSEEVQRITSGLLDRRQAESDEQREEMRRSRRDKLSLAGQTWWELLCLVQDRPLFVTAGVLFTLYVVTRLLWAGVRFIFF